MASTPAEPVEVADPEAVAHVKNHHAWYWFDWAAHGYITVAATVLLGPYLTSVAEKSACGRVGTTAHPCNTNLHVLGIPISPGSLFSYTVTVATLLAAVILPIVGAAADRSDRKKLVTAGYAWTGAAAAALMFFVKGSDWQLGVVLIFAANMMLVASRTVYNAILVDIATPDERDHVSSRGWAFGYFGGGVLLALSAAVVTLHSTLGLEKGLAVRFCLLAAGLWWAGFSVIPVIRLVDKKAVAVVASSGAALHQSFAQLFHTLRGLPQYPVTMMFLLAYLFYNDGIQTVIIEASTYGDKQLGLSITVLLGTILLVQFVAFAGALVFGRLAAKRGSRKVILGGLGVWVVVVSVGYFLPAHRVLPFLALAIGIGLVLGGTQALSRSFFSLLIPRGREAEYFSLYQACELGTSWLGTLVFGLVHQLTGSYRPAILALMVFFVVGGLLLVKVDPARGIREAGNTAPAVV
jgi:MFS transporter, UMF1 family